MALTDNGGLSAADIAAVTGGNRNYGGGFGFGGDGSWWLLILFLFAFCNGGWGNGWGNGAGNNMLPYILGGQQNTNNDFQRVIDNQSMMNGIAGINTALATNQAATTQGMNTIAMSLQNCCCENRAATADLKYTVATEACADRNAVQMAMNQLSNEYRQGNQAVLDKLCQLEMDGIKQNYDNRIYNMQNTIDQLRSQVNEQNRLASQTAQTGQILADNAAQTAALENYLNPPARPAYIVQNPNCCQQMWNNCGCGMN